MGPSTGGTKVVVSGQGFKQIKFENGTLKDFDTWVRMVDAQGNVKMSSQLLTDLSETRFSFITPSAASGTKTFIQLSFNNVQWQTLAPEMGPN